MQISKRESLKKLALLGAAGVAHVADCVDDTAAAVAWTIKHIGEYGGNPKRVFVAGSSAGGCLTMMFAMAPRSLTKYGFKPSDIAGIAPNSDRLRRIITSASSATTRVHRPIRHLTKWHRFSMRRIGRECLGASCASHETRLVEVECPAKIGQWSVSSWNSETIGGSFR